MTFLPGGVYLTYLDVSLQISFLPIMTAQNKPGIFDKPSAPRDGVMESFTKGVNAFPEAFDEARAATFGSRTVFRMDQKPVEDPKSKTSDVALAATLNKGIEQTASLYPKDEIRLMAERKAEDKLFGQQAKPKLEPWHPDYKVA